MSGSNDGGRGGRRTRGKTRSGAMRRVAGMSALIGAGAAALLGSASPGAPPPPDDSAPWELESQLAPDPGPPAGQLGPAVAISAKRCAVGNRRDDDLGSDTGVIHCFDFVRKTWRLAQLLKDPSGCITCDFGAALAMDAERLTVGAPRDGALGFEAGRAHVFVRRGPRWVLETTLARPGAGVDEHFGTALAVDGRVLAVGAPRADLRIRNDDGTESRAVDAGVVEVFELREGSWVHAGTLTSPAPAVSGWFGSAIAVSRDRIAVGAFGEPQSGASAGAVHLFRRLADGWVFEESLAPPWSGPSWFGCAVAMEGDRVLVGAPRARPPGSGSSTGAAFLFERSGGANRLAAVLTAPWLQSGDGLGISVAIDSEAMFAGATGDDEHGEDSGAVYLFARRGSGFRPAERLVVPNLAAGDRCGAALATAAGRVIVGRGGNPEASPAPGEGAAWIFTAPRTAPPKRSSTPPAKSASKSKSAEPSPDPPKRPRRSSDRSPPATPAESRSG